MLLRFTDDLTRWDEIAAIFSKEAVLKGDFDRYAQSSRAKRGVAEVDQAFLAEIEGWRATWRCAIPISARANSPSTASAPVLA